MPIWRGAGILFKKERECFYWESTGLPRASHLLLSGIPQESAAVYYLVLDVKESDCPVLSRKHWDDCDPALSRRLSEIVSKQSTSFLTSVYSVYSGQLQACANRVKKEKHILPLDLWRLCWPWLIVSWESYLGSQFKMSHWGLWSHGITCSALGPWANHLKFLDFCLLGCKIRGGVWGNGTLRSAPALTVCVSENLWTRDCALWRLVSLAGIAKGIKCSCLEKQRLVLHIAREYSDVRFSATVREHTKMSKHVYQISVLENKMFTYQGVFPLKMFGIWPWSA